VWRVLRRYKISGLRDLDPASGRVIRRYEKNVAGEPVHLDNKKFGRSLPGEAGEFTAEGTLDVTTARSDTPICIQPLMTTPVLPMASISPMRKLSPVSSTLRGLTGSLGGIEEVV
jgi:hypothetical protein